MPRVQKQTHKCAVPWWLAKTTLKGCEGKVVFSTDVAKSIGDPYKTMNLDLYFTLHKKINSRWTADLNVKGKIIKFLQESAGEHLHDLGVGKVFLNKT